MGGATSRPGLWADALVQHIPQAVQDADARVRNDSAPPRPGESKREREGASKEGDAAGLSSRLVPKEYAKGKGRPPAYSYFNMGYQRSS